MTVETAAEADPVTAAPTVDATNPWLGLASFTEETRSYFHGREEEVAELARRVQRKRLTVLFGQSGLGKTSILRAGLVPRLRAQGYCPVYVRIDYGRDSPSPAEQIKQAIARTAQRSGQWTQVGVSVAGESLWEFLHHRDDVLHDESGATLTPLLIFDQFEEIFTLGQGDDFGRARAATFVEDLADLVENRPPKALEAKLEADEAAAEGFDFARSDYRVLIALREDYLAPLEGLKAAMPSITQNRLRLAPMTGAQALAAVTGPGGRLVTEEVAAAIVRFIAGGAELANAEVEPSLLSLICRELNDTRIVQRRSEISLDLLDGSRSSILGNFYERALADQPTAVRRVIEDELLTESGFRENVAEERMRNSLAAAGAAPGALALLVNRRLLRIEERLDLRRVELTHDVLCTVVKGSRDLRQEREARDATERLLADQKARELAARHALVRARQIAGGCVALAIVAIVAAGFAYVSTQRARRAEQAAIETHAAAEKARSQAEHLLGYLNADFATELQGFGRLGLIEDLGQRELDYYKSLPAVLQTTDTARSQALAQVRYGFALQLQARLSEAKQLLETAVAKLKALRTAGDVTEETAIGLSLGLGALADVSDREGSGNGLPLSQESEAVLQPYYDAPNASPAVRRAYAKMVTSLGTYQGAAGVKAIERGREALASLGALDLSDVQAAAEYAYATTFECRALWSQGRTADYARLAREAESLAGRVLDVRPGHLVALRARSDAFGWESGAAAHDMKLQDAYKLIGLSIDDYATLGRLDPSHSDDRGAYASTVRIASDYLSALGRPRARIATLRQVIDILAAEKGTSPLNLNQWYFDLLVIAEVHADLGEVAASKAALSEAQPLLARIHKEREPGSMFRVNADALTAATHAAIALDSGDVRAALPLAVQAVELVKLAHGNNELFDRIVDNRRIDVDLLLSQVNYAAGDFAAAEASARSAVERAGKMEVTNDLDIRRKARASILDALVLARLARSDDAAKQLAPALEALRARNALNHDNEQLRFEYAVGLLAEALSDPGKRAADLASADHILRALPAEMQQLHSVRRWQHEVSAELAGRLPAAKAGS